MLAEVVNRAGLPPLYVWLCEEVPYPEVSFERTVRLAREKGYRVAQVKPVPEDMLLRTYEVGGAGALLGTATTVVEAMEEFPLGPRALIACTVATHDPKSAPGWEMSMVTLVVGGVTLSVHERLLHWR